MSDVVYTVPHAVQRLIRGYEKEFQAQEARVKAQKFKITEAIGRLAFFYEKIRNAVDYQDENLLVKTAIERILRRRFVPGENPAAIAKPLLSELIRGGYVANDSLPEKRVEELAQAITKYARFLNKAIPGIQDQQQREEMFDWSITLLACELEDIVLFSYERQAMMEFVYSTMLDRIQVRAKGISEDEIKVQIYVAVLRAHGKYDLDLTSYYLLKYFYPDWHEGKEDAINQVARNIVNIKATLDHQLNHPLQDRLIRQVKKVNVIFTVLHDVLVQHKESNDYLEILQNTPALDEQVEIATEDKYKEIKGRLRRTSIRSIIYIFITKMLLALIIELPYDLFFLGHLNYIPIAINIIFHPLLLFVIALAVHIPAKQNTQKIIESVRDLVYDYEGKEVVYQIRPRSQRSGFVNVLFKFFYTVTYIITFGLLFSVLANLNFNWLGMLLFVLFLTLVSFFGLRVRQMAKELVVLDRKDNIISAIIDFFSIPIVRAGHWLSETFSKINVFVFILDVIIEAPFKLIVEVFEDWLAYIREKREELYD